jgi:hypothetical protein
MTKLFGASYVLACICEERLTNNQVITITKAIEEEGYDFVLLESGIKRFPEVEELLSKTVPLVKFTPEPSPSTYIKNKMDNMLKKRQESEKIVLICSKSTLEKNLHITFANIKQDVINVQNDSTYLFHKSSGIIEYKLQPYQATA